MKHGRHEIFAGGKKVQMDDASHSLLLRENIVTTELQHDLDKLGIAKNAREEKKRARDAKQQASGSGLRASEVDHSATLVPGNRGPQKNDEAYNARMVRFTAKSFRKRNPPSPRMDLFRWALGKANGNGARAAKPHVAEPVAGDRSAAAGF